MEKILYPLGFIASLLFGARVLIQWIESEKEKRSVASKNFWLVSLLANITLVVHSLIQMQFPMMAVQTVQSIISWRNIHLLSKKNSLSYKSILGLMAIALIGTFALFMVRCSLSGHYEFMRVPLAPWDHSETSASWRLNLVGLLGIILFSGRFFLQWVFAEIHQISHFPQSFWWISLSGALLSLFYFIAIGDLVNIIGPLLGFIPYVRNLLLTRRQP